MLYAVQMKLKPLNVRVDFNVFLDWSLTHSDLIRLLKVRSGSYLGGLLSYEMPSNLTNVTQKVLFGGKMFIGIPPGFVAFINPSELGTHFVGLKSNPHARLIVLSS